MIKVGIIGSEVLLDNIFIPVNDLQSKGFSIFKSNDHESLTRFIVQMDILHFIYPFDFYGYAVFSKILGKKVIFHWIGTDVLKAISSRRKHFLLAKILQLFCNKNVCVADHLVSELHEINICSECLPLVGFDLIYNVTSLPKTFTVLAYLPDKRNEFYGSKIIYSLANEFKNILFFVVGGEGLNQKTLPNVEYFGWQDDLGPIYKKSTVLVRMTKHDGTPRMILEALSHGRHVISSINFPHCYHADSYEQVKNNIVYLLENPTLNIVGAKYVVKEYNKNKIASEFERIYMSLLDMIDF